MKILPFLFALFISFSSYSQCKLKKTKDMIFNEPVEVYTRTNEFGQIKIYLSAFLYLQNLESGICILTTSTGFNNNPYPFACRELEIVFHDNVKVKLELDACYSESFGYKCNYIIPQKYANKFLTNNIGSFIVIDELLKEKIEVIPNDFRIIRNQLKCIIPD